MAAPKDNKYAVGNSGLSKKFETDAELKSAIEDYFNDSDKKKEPYTIEGLCIALCVTRQTLLNYEKRKGYEDYFDTIREAKLKVQENLIKRGLVGDNNSTLTIFLLKNNHGYRDKTEQEVTGRDGGPIEANIETHKVIFEDYTKNA